MEKIWLKIYFAEPAQVRSEEFLPVFQKWIQEEKIPGIMIDAADYGHVRNGPGVLLVCADEHFAVDAGGGRAGLLYQRKTKMEGSNRDRVRAALAMLVRAALLLEREASWTNPPRFAPGEIKLSLADRLAFPNTGDTFEAIRDDLESAFAELFRRNVALERSNDDPRELFSATARSLSPVTLDEMRKNLGLQV
ncbi:MAG: hypothetical protein AAB229_06055 [Candidatus Hydrogenedentota bacterium]